jgi:hypothetical protein
MGVSLHDMEPVKATDLCEKQSDALPSASLLRNDQGSPCLAAEQGSLFSAAEEARESASRDSIEI